MSKHESPTNDNGGSLQNKVTWETTIGPHRLLREHASLLNITAVSPYFHTMKGSVEQFSWKCSNWTLWCWCEHHWGCGHFLDDVATNVNWNYVKTTSSSMKSSQSSHVPSDSFDYTYTWQISLLTNSEKTSIALLHPSPMADALLILLPKICSLLGKPISIYSRVVSWLNHRKATYFARLLGKIENDDSVFHFFCGALAPVG